MSYIFIGFILIFFALLGFVELIRFLIFRLYKSKSDHTVMLITPAKNKQEDIEFILRSCVAKVRWMGHSAPELVVCLDKGMDIETKSICKKVCDEYDFMSILTPSQLLELMKNYD